MQFEKKQDMLELLTLRYTIKMLLMLSFFMGSHNIHRPQWYVQFSRAICNQEWVIMAQVRQCMKNIIFGCFININKILNNQNNQPKFCFREIAHPARDLDTMTLVLCTQMSCPHFSSLMLGKLQITTCLVLKEMCLCFYHFCSVSQILFAVQIFLF